ncbi:antibiotic biosynthesis monooxygenase [Bacillus sp. S/N-304-OC-R1]|uniref:antibiotic biosynthesis monooxygenase n=1 Tax=Bacillus sp. S/N-304-OC-R1 TaxID=2758034 RepID=UPI001C8D4D43|nr:antibiotic biosynthesis monooxygenase [Bacillus sp. S/N-304-OC-R1]MBY0121298.1 antibiotic biosynthesis monooxygenase [Bacillus sp. S/N-304-OC-R1]
MFYQVKRIVVKEGFSDNVVEGFDREGLIEKQPGFVGVQVLVQKVRRGDKEVLVLVSWKSGEDRKNWEKSPEHIAGHKAKTGERKPEYIIESSQNIYNLKVSK